MGIKNGGGKMNQQNKNHKKICPLLSAYGQDVDLIYCFEEECEWWSKKIQGCAVKDIVSITDALYRTCERIIEGKRAWR
jgi:hypothetical protein